MSTTLMHEGQQSVPMVVPRQQARRIAPSARPREIVVLAGTAWLTLDGNPDRASVDQWLGACQRAVLPAGAGAVIEAWGGDDLRLRLAPASSAAPRAWLQPRVRGLMSGLTSGLAQGWQRLSMAPCPPSARGHG